MTSPLDTPAGAGPLEPLDELRRRAASLAELAVPGRGGTAERFSALWHLGHVELSLGRLGEAHADGHAILREAGRPDLASVNGGPALFGVWAAEPPDGRVAIDRDGAGWRLRGTKRWCSGAAMLDRALVTARHGDEAQLVCVDLRHDGVAPHPPGEWATPALAAAGTRSVDLDLHLDAGALVGPPGWYLDRSGFWWGAAGVAAVWAGGAAGLLARLLPRWRDDPISLAHLGAAHAGVEAAWATAMAVAGAIDASPGMSKEEAARLAYGTRHVADLTAGAVIDHASRALGPAPAAQDPAISQRIADLALYVRQSHAERDLAALGRIVMGRGANPLLGHERADGEGDESVVHLAQLGTTARCPPARPRPRTT